MSSKYDGTHLELEIQEDALAVGDAIAYLTGNKARIAETKQALKPGVSEYWFVERLGSLHDRLWAEVEALRTQDATQEDGAAVADLDALPVVCPSCTAARAVSLGRRGGRHYFSCKECGTEFWLQEFDDRTQEDTDAVLRGRIARLRDALAQYENYFAENPTAAAVPDKLALVATEALAEDDSAATQEEDGAYHDPMDVHESPSTTPYYHERED